MAVVRFLNRQSVLDALYRFVGGESRVQRFMMGPVDPVHDVSREMELNAQEETLGGLLWPQIQLTHAAADTQEGEFDPYGASNSVPLWGPNGAPEGIWCWLLNVTVTAEAAVNLTVANLSIGIPGVLGISIAQDHLFRVGAAEITINESVALFVSAYVANNIGQFTQPFPMCIPRGGTIRAIATSAAAGGSRFNMVVWYGKVGTYPPGYG